MGFVKEILVEYLDYFKATFARCMFLMHAIIVIWRTAVLLGNKYYIISVGIIGIFAEYFVTLILRNGQEWNWISPATLCYLVSALPGLWLQKLYHLGNYGTIANTSLATVVAEDEAYCYVLLFWWTLAMLQFTLVLTSTHNDDDDNTTTTTTTNKNTTTNNDGTNNNSDTDTELNNDTK
ncbi:hypothetical protein ACOMHN_049288 [Nucella lapillus]